MKAYKALLTTSFILIALTFLFFWKADIDDHNIDRDKLIELSKEINSIKLDIVNLKEDNLNLSNIKNELIQSRKDSKKSMVNASSQRMSNDNSASENDMQSENFDPWEIEKKQEQAQIKKLYDLNTSFISEPLDQVWSPKATELVTSFFDGDYGKNIELLSLQCRKSLCKIEIKKPNESAANDTLMLNFPIHVSRELSQASFFYEESQDNNNNMTIFLVRNGYALSAL